VVLRRWVRGVLPTPKCRAGGKSKSAPPSASGVRVTRHPQVGSCRDTEGARAFTCVNLFCGNDLDFPRVPTVSIRKRKNRRVAHISTMEKSGCPISRVRCEKWGLSSALNVLVGPKYSRRARNAHFLPVATLARAVKTNASSPDCPVAHFSQSTREMGHPLCFLRHPTNEVSYTLAGDVGHPPGPWIASGIDMFNGNPDAGDDAKNCPACSPQRRTGGHR